MHLSAGRALLPLLSAALTPPRSRTLYMGAGFGGAASVKDTFKYSGRVRPGKQSPRRTVPAGIPRPDYWKDGQPKARGSLLPWQIEVKSEADIAGMRAAGRIAREVLDLAGNALKVGMTTDEIDALVHEATIARGAYPSPLNYHGFPKSCCTSVNEVICHGIPDSSQLRDGDICNVDVTCYFGGYHGDCSETFLVGEVDEAGKRLVKATYDAWQAAIAYCAPGREYKGIGAIIEDAIVPLGYTSVSHFCGHGIGSVFHTTPNVIHMRNQEPGKMEAGHTFTIEPMINEGRAQHIEWRDGWTVSLYIAQVYT